MKFKLAIYSKVFLMLLFYHTISAQVVDIKRIDPSNWYVNFADGKLQLLVYGKEINTAKITLKNYTGVKLLKTHKVENPNYVFIDLNIASNTKPGFITLNFEKEGKSLERKYELKAKRSAKTQSLNNSDFIYLIMPDRFSNGDPSNDKFPDLVDSSMNRNNPWLRHGGDLKGIENHFDYFKELGVTALWLTPVLENNQPLTDEGGQMRSAYHGYGITDQYNVDKRFGGNSEYLHFVESAHKNGLKIVQDAVYNHVGKNHWILKDLPEKSWLNQWDKYTNTTYREQPLFDPYASKYDRKVTQKGWFVPFLPDLNQENKFVENYLIQNALWITEYFGIDAWRIDTYFYNDLAFMNRCNAALIKEYPKILIFGESTVSTVANQAYLVKNHLDIPFKSTLPSTLDFQFKNAVNDALKEKNGWDQGVIRFYNTLVQDYLYQNPEKLVTFLDNHDADRFCSVIGEDFDKFKIGLTWLLTSRGIPHLYYGTEILMKNFKNPTDAEVRRDFPGGWAGDKENKFVASGRTNQENDAFDFVKKLANYRKNSNALTKGKLTQFLPFDDGIYAYFRSLGKEKVMVISNSSGSDKNVNTDRFAEILASNAKGKNVITNEIMADLKTINLKDKEIKIIEIKE